MGRIALDPDDLVAIVLPASTDRCKWSRRSSSSSSANANPNAQPPKSWDPSVVALSNSPEVIALINADLTWFQQLGTSVVSQQDAVLDAIQAFRKVQSAGNLTSNDKQTVTVQTENQTEVIVIEPARPAVVYVPSYNQTTVAYPPRASPPPY